jgi:YesN/AraC family two-component response regulator
MDCLLLSADLFIESPTDINVHYSHMGSGSVVHKHNFIEIAYIAQGRGRHIVDGQEHPLERGDLLLINNDVPHQYVSDPDYPLASYNCIFLPQALHREMSMGSHFINVAYEYLLQELLDTQQPASHICIRNNIGSEIPMILEDMYHECHERKEGFRQIMKADLHRLLIHLFRIYRNDSDNQQSSAVYKRLIVNNAIAYMKTHFHEDLRCRDLAERAYISEGYLARIFKDVTGKTLISALQDIRMDNAKTLLSDSNLIVPDVAAQCGYTDIKYFYALFRKTVGCTPGAYRQKTMKRKE